MKVFISWSGERSKRVAELLDDWIRCVIQAVDPWMSSKIDRGTLWFTELNEQLSNTSIGIVCLTQENKNKPWILFESGALAKGLSSNRVCTFLVDLIPTDLENPLAQFNHTLPTHEGIFDLVRTINSSLKETSLKLPILERAFNTYWPQFDVAFNEILKMTEAAPAGAKRDDDNILLEVLSTVRGLDKRLRNVEHGRILGTTNDTGYSRFTTYAETQNTSSFYRIFKSEFDDFATKTGPNIVTYSPNRIKEEFIKFLHSSVPFQQMDFLFTTDQMEKLTLDTMLSQMPAWREKWKGYESDVK